MNTYGNPILTQLPNHLRQYIVEQHYERYTPVDQAVWRYIMRQNHSYLKDVAYYPYIPGLEKAGISIEHIPDLQDMNDHLQQIGWGAVTVDGFIPPVAFMEFQAYHVLVIAADIRQLEHIAYTPAPDIIHESSGHAPIIAEPDYATYLSYFGEIGSKAMFSHKDFQQYEAIRKLSILKESPHVTEEALLAAEQELIEIQNNMGKPSEMALLSRLHWWTVEYGLIGTVENPKIYGAGLLSSIGESASCMQDTVKKIPYTIDAVHYSYDITKPQPQLFVTPDFEQLLHVLNQFADTMALRLGGKESLEKAIECKNVCTAVYSSGLQVSGVFINTVPHPSLIYLQTTGPTALSVDNKELVEQGKQQHQNGFGSPVGKLIDCAVPLENFTETALADFNLVVGREAEITFTSNINVTGKIEKITYHKDKIVLIRWLDCTVTDRLTGHVYFQPEWGIYDMAVGEKIVSVCCGAADKNAYEQINLRPQSSTPVHSYDKETLLLHQYYRQVRNIREQSSGFEQLPAIWHALSSFYPQDWLCSLEIVEILIANSRQSATAAAIKAQLMDKAAKDINLMKLINDGLALLYLNDDLFTSEIQRI